MQKTLKILFAEDNQNDYFLAVKELKKAGINISCLCVENEMEYIKEIEIFQPDIIISDYTMPSFDGLRALKIKQHKAPDIPLIIFTGSINEQTAVECMKAGADDYVLKEQMKRLVFAIPSAIEKKKAQAELKKNQEEYQLFFEEDLTGNFFSTPKGKLLKCNNAYLRILGFDNKEEALSYNLNKIYKSEKDREKVLELLKREKKLENYEMEIYRKDGKQISIIENLVGSFDEKGNLQIIKGYIINNTEKKAAESELKKLSKAVEQSPHSIIITDKHANIEYVNPFFEKTTGYTLKEIKNTKPPFINSNKKKTNETSVVLNAINSNGIWKEKFQNKKKNGELFWESVTISPMYNEHNEITNYICISEDITEKIEAENALLRYQNQLEHLVEERTKKIELINERLIEEIEKQKKTDEELKNHNAFLNTLLQTIPNPYYLKDKDKIIVDCNEPFAEMLQLKKEKILGNRIEDIRPVAKREWYSKYEKIENKLLKKKGVEFFEFDRHEFNEYNYYLNYIASVENFEGRIIGLLGIIVDISERKKLENKIALSLEKEIELNQLKSNFISFVSHEFRTPLTSILATADLLELKGECLEKSKILEHIKRIQNSVFVMNDLLEDVLTINRIEKGVITFNPQVDNLKATVEEVINQMKNHLKHSQKIITNKFVLPEEGRYDKKLLKHILENIIGNAIKFSNYYGIIHLNAFIKANNTLFIEIIDGGIGIPAKDLPHIFEPFTRGKNTGEYKGSGLGLSIVETFVKMHNGIIKIESQENIGTHVTVELPLEDGTIQK